MLPRSMSQVRADARLGCKNRPTAWLMRKRLLLIQRLIVTDEILAKRGLPLLSPLLVELLAVAGKRHREDPVVRAWRLTDE